MVTPYMISIATNRGISVIYHGTALLISTTGVVYTQISYNKLSQTKVLLILY